MLDSRPPYDKGCLPNAAMLVQAGVTAPEDDRMRAFFESEADEEDDAAEMRGFGGAIARLCNNELWSCF